MNLLTSDELMVRARSLPALEPLLEAASGIEHHVYLVGGAVRDLLSDGDPIDIDVCIEGPVTALLDSLPGEGTVHQRFGTATVTYAGMRFDIAEARTELYPEPGALPQVRPADIARDLRRRDFTVNAIAVDLRSGDMSSVEGALDDLRQGRLEVLHDRSFIDDPTRLLRLVRYRARLGFNVADKTLRLAQQAIRTRALEQVSGARIGNELRLLATEPEPATAFSELAELGSERTLLRGLGFTDGLSSRGPAGAHVDHLLVATKALAVLPADGRRDLVVLSVYALGMPRAALTELLDELAFSAQDRDRIVAAATSSRTLADALRGAGQPSEIATAVGSARPEQVALAAALGAEQQAGEWLEQLRHMRLAISGDDLAAAGVPPGPAIGVGLRAARLAMLDGHAERRGSQLQIALDAARSL